MWITCNEEHFQKLQIFRSSKRMSQGFEYHTAFTSIASGENIMITRQQAQGSKVKSTARIWIYAPVLATSFLALAQPTQADISNSATASGTYSGNPVTSAPDTVDIPVVAANPSLSIAKSIGTAASILAGADATITDANDTIVYHYIITNNGNVTITGVTPVDTGPLFGTAQVAGTGSLSGFTLTSGSTTLLPGQAAEFDATYTLSALDVYRAAGLPGPADAVNNSATGSGTAPDASTVTSPGGSATTTIAAGPRLTVSKVGVLDDTNGSVAGEAEVTETITYTYTVVNTGNVAITGIVINDTHEGSLLPQAVFSEGGLIDGPLAPGTVSSDAAVNGSWDALQPGASITFTYVHTVTQAEVDGG
jgi:uncharacterized repeat protein (TIGR01451 family)